MSAPSTRGQRGGSSTRGGRGSQSFTPRGRGSTRGQPKPLQAGRGRGRGAASANTSSNSGDGLLQRLRAGTVKRGSDNGGTTPIRGRGASTTPSSTPNTRGRGRGRGFLSQTFNAPNSPASTPPVSRTASPAPTNHRDFMNAAYARFQELKTKRETERAKAIRDGFLADPEKKTSLDKAITPVGTCTEMCPEFERVERTVQNMVDKAEKVHNEDTGKDIPSEERMVKRFRRSAAGYDEQLPSDIRTPATLRKTLDYLLDKVVGGEERLAPIHKFVWDRTRGIRNDFSIQQVTNIEDVKIAVDCYERIARFHILSLHQLSNPDNLWDGENFDAHQEREQLNNTLLSLLYYYDDNRSRIEFTNEAEFRAYCIIFEFQSQHPDLEDRIQAWPANLLKDKRVQTAIKLYQNAGNSLFDQGPLRPMEPFPIAQSNTGGFWHLLSSKAVPYIMACVAEIYFAHVRFAALDALWRSCKSAPAAQQAKSRDWSLAEVTAFLGFDADEETTDFCAAFELYFGTDEHGEEYLDVTSNASHSLDQSSIPNKQTFSHSFVEKKRYHRTLTAVINGISVGEAIRQGLIEVPEDEADDEQNEVRDDDQSMFVPQDQPQATTFGTSLNPEASTFTPKFGQSIATSKTIESSAFGQPTSTSTFGKPSTGFASSGFGGFGSSPVPVDSPFGKPSPAPRPPTQQNRGPSSFGGFTTSVEAAADKGKDAIPENSTPSIAAEQKSVFGSLGGLGMGKAAALTQTSSPSPSISTTTVSGVPPIFGQNAPSQAGFSFTKPAEVSTTKPGDSQPPISFTNFSQPPSDPSKPKSKEDTPQPQVGNNTPSSLASPAPLFGFQQQPVSQPPSTKPETLLPPSTPGFSFQSAPKPTPSPAPPLFGTQPTTASKELSKPPSDAFKFPPIQAPTTSSPNQSSTPPPSIPSQRPASVASQPEIRPQRSTTPPHSPPQLLPQPPSLEIERERLAHEVSRIALLRQDGLIRKYIEYTIPDLVKTAFNQHRLEIHDAAVASIRERILQRKFGLLWRSQAWKNNLSRRARNRRKLIAATMKAEEAKKKRGEEELEEILQAAQETKRLQQEVREAAEAKKLKEKQDQFAISQIVGRKRKSFSGQKPKDYRLSVESTHSSSFGHKRSKTMSTSSEPSSSSVLGGRPPVPAFHASTTRPTRVSIFSGKSVFGRSTSIEDLRRSSIEQKMDNTHTDYFRLKAMGLDPETPIIPDTKETLAIRRRKEEEERQSVLTRARRRPFVPSSTQSSPPATSPLPVPAPIETSPLMPKPPAPIVGSNKPVVEDDFLKQIREAREAMKEQEDWFKQQAVELEKEMEQQEDFKKSQNSLRESVTSANGLTRVNGYEYLPSQSKLGSSLSRTELRIRQTGAHGLATKPLRVSGEYVPVAMSKKSAQQYYGGESQASSPARKRYHEDIEFNNHLEPTFVDNSQDYHLREAGYAVKRPKSGAQSIPQQSLQPIQKSPAKVIQANTFSLLQEAEQDENEPLEDEDESLEEEEDELYDEDGPDDRYYSGDYGNAEEELEEDEDGDEHEREGYEDEVEDEEESGEDEDESDDVGYGGTPFSNPELSRAASSAPGGSADDALVLSDSD
ncbi:actin cytoskeleton and mitosis protein [Knufia peltigerae]|uniref:Actin cytoskeleton and mitosis protein n=1 Tax=Knufia peltigerae TaxID=1002370 RepID=A0AA39CYT0_9EURO|nr:actin cytoskeleton and mitosis protein [Knufia peltigerae]